MNIQKIIKNNKIEKYLEKRQLLKQFEKIEKYILNWNFKAIDFKLREPKKDEIYYFRINKQFRVYWKIFKNTLVILDIDNHQN